VSISDVNRRIRSHEDAESLILGLTFFGTGGGGAPEKGMSYLTRLLDEGYEPAWEPVEAIDSDAVTCCVFGMGSVAPRKDAQGRPGGTVRPGSAQRPGSTGRPGGTAGTPIKEERPALRAVRTLERHLDTKVNAIVASELGASNTLVAIDVAARLGIPVVDGDYTGRALPEMTQCLACAGGMVPWPLGIADPWGNSLVLESAADEDAAERIGKALSVITKASDPLALCAHAGFAHPMAECRDFIVAGSISRAFHVGQALFSGRNAATSLSRVAAEAADGKVMFEGTVQRKEWADTVGYMIGTTTIQGSGDFAGQTARIWLKNENHVLWIDDVVQLTSPDLINVVSETHQAPRTNTQLQEGERVGVVAVSSDQRFHRSKALEGVVPSHYGFQFGYVGLTP
jgi:uncharacterized protein